MPDQPSGYCECGCGGRTRLAPYSDRRRGTSKGQPQRFIHGHYAAYKDGISRRATTRWLEEDRGYATLCWVWQLSINAGGYGRETACEAGGKRTRLAHRGAYEDRYGPVPEGFELDHLCRVRACVNPDHLEVVTRATNTRRGASAILNEVSAKEVRALARQGWLHVDIAAAYGLARSTVGGVVGGRRWRAV